MLITWPTNNLRLLIRMPHIPPLLPLRPLIHLVPHRHPRRRRRHAIIQWRLLLYPLTNRHEPRIGIPLLCRPLSAQLLHLQSFRDDGGLIIEAPRIRVPTRGNEEREVHHHDDEAQRSPDGHDDTFAVDVVGVIAYDLILTQIIIIARVIPEIRLRAPRCDCSREGEPKPQQKIARDIGAGMDRSLAVQEHDDVGDVPKHGEPQRDELPGQVIVVAAVGPGVVHVAVVGRGREEGRVREGPPDEARAGEGEDDGEGAQDVFPEEGGVVGVDLLAGAEGGG